MKGVCVLIVLGVFTSWASAQFLNHRPFPTFSLENMPDTEFSCRDKILGGYYADAQTECQMFHICVKVAGVGVQDFRFLCPNGTAFDQDHQICADWEDVDCDATTLYYSSDNFDLYRIGSGFESKAKKYGEDEETFSLQRAETGDARINREHQAQRVNQQKDLPVRKHKVQIQNNNNNNNNDNANSERDIFKGSSSSNFFNNRNGGKESDDDYDDNVNANQDRDQFQKRKIVRKQQRRPAQNEDQSQNNQQERRPAQNNNNNQEQQERRPVQRRPVQQQENFNRRPNNQQNEQISRRPQNNQQQNNRRPVNSQSEDNFDSRRTQNNDEDVEAQTYRPHRPTGFINNFAGSSFVPTTSRPVSTTLNNDQYTTAVNNYNQRNHNNNQRSRNNENSPTPTYTISTPAPFRQTQQYNNPPSRQNNNGQYTTPSSAPQKETENYPVNFPKQPYQQQSTPQKVNNKPTQNYPTEAPVIRNTQYNNNYESTKIKQTKATENYQTASPSTSNNFRNTQYDAQKTKASSTKQTENHPTPAPFSKNTQQFNTQHYDVPKTKSAVTTKQTENYPSSPVNNNNKKSTTPVKNYEYTPTAAPSRSTNNKQQGSSTGFNNNYPSTFAPRTNAGYTQISQQTTQYKSSNNQKATTAFNGNNNQRASTPVNNNGNQQNFNSQRATTPFNNNQQNFNGNQKSTTSSNNNNGQNFNTNQQNDSTPKSTPFAQYTPTVPKISSTTPVSRSNRYDETQYDDGSYDSRYENGNGNNNRRDDEFLKTAHSQNIASSRNELAKTTKNVAPSTQRPQYESPRPFSVTSNTPKITSTATQKPLEPPRNLSNNQQNNKQGVPSSSTGKKVKDASYDYAYYDTNVGSEPEYDIDADIKKSTVKN